MLWARQCQASYPVQDICLLLIHTQILEKDGLEKGTFVICCSIHFTLVLYPLSDKVCKGYIDFVIPSVRH